MRDAENTAFYGRIRAYLNEIGCKSKYIRKELETEIGGLKF